MAQTECYYSPNKHTPSVPKYKSIFYTSVVPKTLLYFETEGVAVIHIQYITVMSMRDVVSQRRPLRTRGLFFSYLEYVCLEPLVV